MRFDNQSVLDDTQLREAATFAARGVRDSSVLLKVRMRPSGHTSVCWLRAARRSARAYRNSSARPGVTADPPSVNWVIELRVAQGARPLPLWTHYRTTRIRSLYPSQIKLKPQDAMVWMLAYSVRRLWQEQRRDRRRSVYDADKWSWWKLCQWRVATGRNQIVPLKQPDPFRRWRESQARQSRQRATGMRQAAAGRRLITIEEDDQDGAL